MQLLFRQESYVDSKITQPQYRKFSYFKAPPNMVFTNYKWNSG